MVFVYILVRILINGGPVSIEGELEAASMGKLAVVEAFFLGA